MADPARLLEHGMRACPYPGFAEVRMAEPVWVPGRPAVVFGSAAACRAVLRHPLASSDRAHALLHQADESVREMPSFLFMDPPRHTRLRRLAATAFTPRIVRGMEPIIRELVDDLIDRMGRGGRVDLMDDLASPLPVAVICRALGVELPDGDWRWYRHRSSLLGQAVDPYPALAGTAPPGLEDRQRAEAELTEFFGRMVEDRRRRPRVDLASALIASEVDGDRLTDTEIITTCRLLLNAGHETTVNLLANGMLALLGHPRCLAELRADPARADDVVEETLRTDPPLQMVHRYAAGDLDVLGTTVPQGTTIVLLLAAANRDGDEYRDPDHFAPGRHRAGNLGFGLGTHFCLGATLARLEGRLAFIRFAQRVQGARLAGPLVYRRNIVLRGLTELPVTVDGVRDRATPW